METNKLYFIKETYFTKYYNLHIQKNKGTDHNRPCYYAFKEGNILWMAPISSQIGKYEKEYKKSVEKYGICDTISFVYIKGNKNAVLIQNMIPIIPKYINNLYVYKNTTTPVDINNKKKKEINAKMRKVLRFARNGKNLTFTPILQLESLLKKELEKEIKQKENNHTQ